MSPKIRIVDYDEVWPQLFQREADRIKSVLGRRALCVEHIGSTSVPGLAAKPTIDVLLVVANSADEGAYLSLLEDVGYKLLIREPEWHEHRMFKGPEADVNLHVFSSGCPEIGRVLAFRDRLRKNEADRELYMCAKRELAQKDWEQVQIYADAKTAVIEMILSRAHELD
jgi:GrpB-like predicted nucleotidyltransferase (UPF0157 family)